jgi:hypothetical protein
MVNLAKAFCSRLIDMLETFGRVNAASQLARMGYHEEAKRLISSK